MIGFQIVLERKEGAGMGQRRGGGGDGYCIEGGRGGLWSRQFSGEGGGM